MTNILITLFNREVSDSPTGTFDEDKLLVLLEQKVNEMIEYDFEGLIRALYQIDVSEQKLKQLLKESGGREAPLLISKLILERQLEKIKYRNTSGANNPADDDEEKW